MKRRIALLAIFWIVLCPVVWAQSKKVIVDGNEYISKNSRYPILEQKGTLYFPLTANNLKALGLEYSFQSGRLEIEKSKEMPSDHLLFYPRDPSLGEVKEFPFLARLKTYPMDPKIPLLQYKNILYFPLTERNCREIMGWNYQWKDGALIIDTKKDLFYQREEEIYQAIENRLYRLEDFDLFEKKGEAQKQIYRLPKIATGIEFNVVDGNLHVRYKMGQSKNSQERHVLFGEQPMELYSGKYQYFTWAEKSFLLQQDIIRNNLLVNEEGEYREFVQSPYVFKSGINEFDTFTQDFSQGPEKIYLLASLDGLVFDRIVAIDSNGSVEEVLQDRFLRGFTGEGDALTVYNDFGIYTFEGQRKERKVLRHTDAIRVFPSKNPLYIHQNLSLYRGSEDQNPKGKVHKVVETREGEHLYTWIEFRGTGKYQNILLKDGEICRRGEERISQPSIGREELFYYIPRSDKIIHLPLGEERETK